MTSTSNNARAPPQAEVPTQFDFYTNLNTTMEIPPETECTICLNACESSEDVLSVEPCYHFFHRQCIISWFDNNLRGADRRRPDAPNYGTCPNCRTQLFTVEGLSDRDIIAHKWWQQLYVFRGTGFDAIFQEAEKRIQADGHVSQETVEWTVQELVKDPANAAAAREAGFSFPRPGIHRVRTEPTRRNPVNVSTDQDRAFLGQTLRIDVLSLSDIVRNTVASVRDIHALITQARSTRRRRGRTTLQNPVAVNWIAQIPIILAQWYESGYPRTDYITIPALHQLTVAAALVYEVGAREPLNHHVGFAQLLAHADNLLLNAQREARSTYVPHIEYVRLLDRPDHFHAQGQVDSYSGNQLRVQWIVALRNRVRGRNADPFGRPAPAQTTYPQPLYLDDVDETS
jgi:hypothetical protein